MEISLTQVVHPRWWQDSTWVEDPKDPIGFFLLSVRDLTCIILGLRCNFTFLLGPTVKHLWSLLIKGWFLWGPVSVQRKFDHSREREGGGDNIGKKLWKKPSRHKALTLAGWLCQSLLILMLLLVPEGEEIMDLHDCTPIGPSRHWFQLLRVIALCMRAGLWSKCNIELNFCACYRRWRIPLWPICNFYFRRCSCNSKAGAWLILYGFLLLNKLWAK